MNQLPILIADDEAEMRELIALYLQREGYDVMEASNGFEVLQLLKNHEVALILLDIMMPQLDGMSTCVKIREVSNVPVIFVTARGDEWDTIHGLRIGADDYISKPFSPHELVARIEAVLRRTQKIEHEEETTSYGPISIDEKGRLVKLNGQLITLTLKEFDLLLTFCQHEGQVLSREQLLNKVWGYDYYGTVRTVDTHVKTLRLKLGEEASLIQTVWGIGYKFEV